MTFWNTYKTPAFTLAPMEDVTDTVFRYLVMRLASPKYLRMVMTEFLSVDGFLHDVGRENVKHRLFIHPNEEAILKEKDVKIVAQIWGTDPENFFKVAEILSNEYNFDGVDINMGCPMKKIIKNGACSALILNPSLAQEIVQATQEGSKLPVSIKTRLGMKEFVTEKWIENLLKVKPAAISIHGRIQKQIYKGKADWEEIQKAVRLRDRISPEVVIHGNGDIYDVSTGVDRIKESGVDGVMIGRGILKNPWFFNDETFEINTEHKLDLLIEHSALYEETWKGVKNFAIMKRFFSMYANGFEGAPALRNELVRVKNHAEVEAIVKQYRNKYLKK
jgi:tRNA-dihydrouridine synthase